MTFYNPPYLNAFDLNTGVQVLTFDRSAFPLPNAPPKMGREPLRALPYEAREAREGIRNSKDLTRRYS